jgi:predicted phosphoribosyltransferase
LCKKIYAPRSTQIGIGTLLPDGSVLLNKDLISFLGITRYDINQGIKEASIALAQYEKEFQARIEIPDLTGKTAVIVDDGIASGFTALGALNVIRKKNPKHIIVATPVCSSIAIEILKSCNIELTYLISTDSTSFLVDDFYVEFEEVTIEQAHACLMASIVD